MKIKRLSVLFAVLLFVSAFCMAGRENSSQAPEAIVVSIYKVEKEQDEDGKVYITNYDLWKSYNVTPTQAIDLPDYDPEKEDKDCKVSYKNNYSQSTSGISGIINGEIVECKNKIQLITNFSAAIGANSIIFARERKKKTINFFYEGKNITESLSATQIEQFNKIFKDTYAESFSLESLADFVNIKYNNSSYYNDNYKSVSLYTTENGEKAFFSNSVYSDYYDYYGYYRGGSFTLIKSTDVYIKVSA